MDALIENLRDTIEKADELLNQTNKSESRISLYAASLEKKIDRLCGYEKVDGATDQSKEIWLAATKAQLKLSDELAKLRNGSRISPSRTGPSDPSVNTSTTLPRYLKGIKKKNVCVRRTLYVEWSNSIDVKSMFYRIIRLVKSHFLEHVLTFNDDIPNQDILDLIIDDQLLENPVNDIEKIEIILRIQDYPLSFPVIVAERIIQGQCRTSATSLIREVGCQHLFLHKKMVYSSEAAIISSPKSETRKRKTPSSSTSTTDDSSVYECQSPKKLKTCQLACRVDCDRELSRHWPNSTFVKGTPIIVDVLFFIPNKDVLEKLAAHLGLISIDKLVREAKIEADLEEIFQLRLDNPDANVYRLIQAYINRDLMFGRSNICITSRVNVFNIVNANVKVALLQESESVSYSIVERFSSMVVEIPDEGEIFHYITGVAEVMENILKTESINVTYCSSDKYYNLKLPLCSVIPLYILRFFSQILISKSNIRYDYFDIK